MKNKILYQELSPIKITKTIAKLSVRIQERFPSSSLFKVSEKLLTISRRAEDQATWISQPIIGLRVIVAILIFFILFAIIGVIYSIEASVGNISIIEFIQALEAGINDVVLIAIAIFFLITLENRFKRHRALKMIHELRAIAHIIDMHQLTKDPVRLHWESQGVIQSKSGMSSFLMSRYLDYCSEMLSLVSKISALYVQKFDDSVALSAVNEIEQLTTSLSRKIWQKLMIHDVESVKNHAVN